MSNLQDGGPAFPATEEHGCNSGWSGMSLRDYLAAKAMQALLSTCDVSRNGYNHELDRRAVQAYLMADTMLKARLG